MLTYPLTGQNLQNQWAKNVDFQCWFCKLFIVFLQRIENEQNITGFIGLKRPPTMVLHLGEEEHKMEFAPLSTSKFSLN